MTNGYAIGIDFGTTKSHLAFIPRNSEGQNAPQFATYFEAAMLTPTLNDVPFTQAGSGGIHEPVPTLIAIDKESPDMSRPQLIVGFGAIDPKQPNLQNFELVTNLKERIRQLNAARTVTIEGNDYPIEGLVARYIWSLMKHAKELSNQSVDAQGVTITVPAKAGIVQRMTMQFSAAVAGLDGKIEIVEEPVAAFLYHAHLHPEYFETRRGKPRHALVVDFGGGTCDVAVIQFIGGQLPRVIGRAMGRFGGGTIDEMFMRKFWMTSIDKGGIPMNWDDYKNADEMTRAILLAHARKTKELISSQVRSLIADISGSIPFATGKIEAPGVHRDALRDMLENDPWEVEYADPSEVKSNTIKGHLVTLIDQALFDAGINRSNIGKLILAGGSVKLCGVRDWITDFLTTDQGRGVANTQIDESNIHDQHSDICIAGGAAIHQLYRHHKNRKWHGAVTPTLSSKFWMISYRGSSSPNEVDRTELGSQHQRLPIDCTSYFRAKLIYPVRYSSNGKITLEIGQGEDTLGSTPEWRNVYTLPEEFGSQGSIGKLLKSILVRYYIDEFGILQKITWTPGLLPVGWNSNKKVKKDMVLREGADTELGLQSLRLDNRIRIDTLSSQFIPSSLRRK